MANFHTDFLVIAANETDMCQVLDCFARNIDNSGVDDDFSYEQYARATSLQERYFEVYGGIENDYMYALSTAPAGSEGMRTSAPIQVGSATIMMSFAPHGRGLSDTASVSMEQCGDTWVFTLNYSTAWVANTDDIDSFLTGLPVGEYGVAFYDADEGDGYESVGCFSGLHHGGGGLHSADPIVRDTCLDISELKKERKKEMLLSRGSLVGLADVARVTATRNWPEYWTFSDDEGEGEEEESYFHASDGTTLSVWGRSSSMSSWGMSSVNWQHPSPDDLDKIDEALLKDLAGLPWMHRIDTTTPEGAEAVESLMAGDLLIGRTRWKGTGERPDIEILTTGGVLLGLLHYWDMSLGYGYNPLNGVESLSCLMPHLRIRLVDLKPVSLRNRGMDHAELTLYFEAEQIDAEKLVDEVHAMLAQEPEERTCTSISTEVR